MLAIENLTKRFYGRRAEKYQSVAAVDDVSFEVPDGHFFTLLGPSGCGKSTTLRCIAGLERPDEGVIRLDNNVLYSSQRKVWVNANDRGFGMVFQSYAIWPHMNVYGNVAFPLEVSRRRTGMSRSQIHERVERALDAVQLGSFIRRPATDLSGGQQQRLALARAVVGEPPLLLLDEPLSNLDAKLREEMRFEIKRLQSEFGVTAIYVTHDQAEALAMSDVIAVMNAGRIEQIGLPGDIYDQPDSEFVARFIGISNLIDGTVVDADVSNYEIETAVGRIVATGDNRLKNGDAVTVVARAESVSLAKDVNTDGLNRIRGRVERSAFLGEIVDHTIRIGDLTIRVRSDPSLATTPGTDVVVVFDPSSLRLIPSS